MTYRDTPCESEQKPAAVGFQPVRSESLAGLTVSNINSTNLLRDVEFTQTCEAWVKLLEVYLTTSVLCGNDVIQRPRVSQTYMMKILQSWCSFCGPI